MLRNVKTLNIYFFPFLPTLPSPQNAEYVILSPKPTPILSIHFFFTNDNYIHNSFYDF